MTDHPFHLFQYCPKCGSNKFVENNCKSKKCMNCNFIYYFNPSAAVVAIIFNEEHELLTVTRANNPAKGTLDLPGGFVDSFETAEQAVKREVKEETNLEVISSLYLLSVPNIYMYSGFEVHTLDIAYQCKVSSFEGITAMDDAASMAFYPLNKLNTSDFGLESIKKIIEKIKISL